jgi:hypothetical protein
MIILEGRWVPKLVLRNAMANYVLFRTHVNFLPFVFFIFLSFSSLLVSFWILLFVLYNSSTYEYKQILSIHRIEYQLEEMDRYQSARNDHG